MVCIIASSSSCGTSVPIKYSLPVINLIWTAWKPDTLNSIPWGVLSISEMGHFLNRTLLRDQAVLASSLRPWLYASTGVTWKFTFITIFMVSVRCFEDHHVSVVWLHMAWWRQWRWGWMNGCQLGVITGNASYKYIYFHTCVSIIFLLAGTLGIRFWVISPTSLVHYWKTNGLGGIIDTKYT